MSNPNQIKECCNPFSNHKHVRENLRFVSPVLVSQAKQMKIELHVDKYICHKCRFAIQKPSVAKEEEEESESESDGAMNISQRKCDRVCLNPFSLHENNRKKNLREITQELIEKAKALNLTIEAGQFICNKCRLHMIHAVDSFVAHETVDYTDMDMDIDIENPGDPSIQCFDKNDVMTQLDALLKSLNMSPIDHKRLADVSSYQCDLFTELKSKLIQVVFTKVKDKIDDHNNDNEMIEQMKEKFGEISDKNEKFKFLSMVPKSWSSRQIANEFGVSKHTANTVKQLVATKGIFCNKNKQIGRPSIASETVEKVVEFYRDNEISKLMPGMRDYVV